MLKKNNWVCFKFDIDYESIKSDKACDWLTSTMVSWSDSFNGLKSVRKRGKCYEYECGRKN